MRGVSSHARAVASTPGASAREPEREAPRPEQPELYQHPPSSPTATRDHDQRELGGHLGDAGAPAEEEPEEQGEHVPFLSAPEPPKHENRPLELALGGSDIL